MHLSAPLVYTPIKPQLVLWGREGHWNRIINAHKHLEVGIVLSRYIGSIDGDYSAGV